MGRRWCSIRSGASRWSPRCRPPLTARAPTFEFLLENGVRFIDNMAPRATWFLPGVPRLVPVERDSDDWSHTIAGKGGSGVVRPLERSARAKGVEILLEHRLTRVVREAPLGGRVTGIEAEAPTGAVEIRARRGVVLATGGHTSNVDFRRDVRPAPDRGVPGRRRTMVAADR